MTLLPDQRHQILITHAPFIRKIVETSQSRERQAEFESLLQMAESNGWSSLVQTIRKIVAGPRDMNLLVGLDDEDRVIAEAVLLGLQDPNNLPDPNVKPDPDLAAPGLAKMILASARGNVQALTLISNMAEQMSRVGGPMARLAAVIRPMINGERDEQRLCKGMGEKETQMIRSILTQLRKSELN